VASPQKAESGRAIRHGKRACFARDASSANVHGTQGSAGKGLLSRAARPAIDERIATLSVAALLHQSSEDDRHSDCRRRFARLGGTASLSLHPLQNMSLGQVAAKRKKGGARKDSAERTASLSIRERGEPWGGLV